VIGSRIVQEIENSAEECVISNVSGLVKEFSLAIN
jgi:tryptophan synthase alpha subunit